MNVMMFYKTMSEADKLALKALQAEETSRRGAPVQLSEMIDSIMTEAEKAS